MSDLDRYQYGYDQNSNRLYKANVVGTSAVGYLDEGYTYDNLNRLTMMQRGTLNSGRTGISGTPSREMDYTLDPTGNWSAYLTKTNGTTDLSQTRTANKVNEITAIGGTPAWVTPPVYDAAGNMTSFPQPATPASAFTATYDAWNRMVSINNSSGSVATYQYDGMGRRIVKTTTGTGGQTRHFFYTNNWQDIEERVGTATTMDKQYVWGVRYIDELVCRDDATPQRLYAMQDANFNLTSISNTSGGVVERYYYDPYGTRTIMNGSWSVISASAYSWVIGHQGLMQDSESGLIYNRARYLHPTLGTFMGRDAFNYTSGANLFEYINSNASANQDPSGMVSYDDMVALTQDCDDGNVSSNLLLCLTWQESSFRTNTPNAGAGAVGLGQMTQSACKDVDQAKKWPAGTCWNRQNSGNACQQISNTSIFLQILIKRSNGSVQTGLVKYGPGGKNGNPAAYANPILDCKKCLDAAQDQANPNTFCPQNNAQDCFDAENKQVKNAH